MSGRAMLRRLVWRSSPGPWSGNRAGRGHERSRPAGGASSQRLWGARAVLGHWATSGLLATLGPFDEIRSRGPGWPSQHDDISEWDAPENLHQPPQCGPRFGRLDRAGVTTPARSCATAQIV